MIWKINWGSLRSLRAAALAISIGMLGAYGCATIGNEFPTGPVSAIKIGETTQNDIYAMFGAPWRTGIDSGMKTWTYGHYRYSLFNDGETEDLVIKFDRSGVVSSYVFNTTRRSK